MRYWEISRKAFSPTPLRFSPFRLPYFLYLAHVGPNFFDDKFRKILKAHFFCFLPLVGDGPTPKDMGTEEELKNWALRKCTEGAKVTCRMMRDEALQIKRSRPRHEDEEEGKDEPFMVGE